ncbi:MAG: class I SAM-dependent methyltransferase [Promethearchaeota archaeon]
MDIVEQLIPLDARRVLDVGCGDIDVKGHLYCHNRLKRKYKNVLGIDLNPGRQENVIQASAMRIPFVDESIEYVVSFDVIEHIKDYSVVIEDILRVAIKRVIIIVPTTKNRSFRQFLKFLRRMLRGVDNFVFQGHYYEFFPSEICRLKTRNYSCNFITIDYPILGASIFNRKGFITAGIYVFDRLKQES